MGTPLLQAIEEAPLGRRYWEMAIAIMLGSVLEFFDFYLISFVVPVVSDEWDLTYGEAAAVLLSAGVGAIAGSVAFGRFGDRYGRRKPLIAGILTFSIGTGLLAAAPEDGWWYLAALRFAVGVGVGGVAAVAVPLLLEFTPTRVRSKLVGLITTAMIPLAILLAALVSAAFIPLVGWRPIFAIGVVPAALALYVWRRVPESPRWLIEHGRGDEARDLVAEVVKRPREELEPAKPRERVGQAGFGDLLRYRRSFWGSALTWFGVAAVGGGIVLWGPTFLETLLKIEEEEAALLFAVVTLGSFAGRLTFSLLPQRIGRRRAGMIAGFGAAPILLLAGLAGDSEVGYIPLFLLALVLASFFADGVYANLVPFTPETFPTHVRAQAMGMAQAVNGLGRIVGPAVLAAIAGTGSVVAPAATADALAPGFAFLAACSLLVGAAFWLVALEPHGKDLETLEAEIEEHAAARRGARALPVGGG